MINGFLLLASDHFNWQLVLLIVLILLFVVPKSRAAKSRPPHASQHPVARSAPAPRPKPTQPVTPLEHKLQERLQKVQAQRTVTRTLIGPAFLLQQALSHRAMTLYAQEMGISVQEVARACMELERAYSIGMPSETPSQGADPAVTTMLLRAGCRDDALLYYRLSSGATPQEAESAVNYLQELMSAGLLSLDEESRQPPDPFALHFLVRSGYRLLALRYYRERTGAPLLVAREALERF
ncbi:hypothetical protein EI42_05463 [Thermosporothrix hazakensis]|jgi:hypothetical protein|uniref:Uncharacterized protein n=1 Tax=Thermosporothrix hazakensis TaxID=644383 RepID=A0A326TYV9_THEHA|nr:hypothetical protein [Thermosporothrix hazakensis]PZW22441.1 hypothetical protein EI42_05463 [Thermosporothrix hazakensis]GCE45499.1 hypothetical protein KTH_03680 [Thermosporothrix hazakensis]